MEKSPARIRTLAFLISGLVDCIFGGILLLFWLDLLPFDWIEFGIPRIWAGVVGSILAFSGLVVVVYQATKLKEPDE